MLLSKGVRVIRFKQVVQVLLAPCSFVVIVVTGHRSRCRGWKYRRELCIKVHLAHHLLWCYCCWRAHCRGHTGRLLCLNRCRGNGRREHGPRTGTGRQHNRWKRVAQSTHPGSSLGILNTARLGALSGCDTGAAFKGRLLGCGAKGGV